MLRHIVLFRRKPDVEIDLVLEAKLAKDMLELGSKISVIKEWSLRKNELERPICWDYVLDSKVEDVQSLNDYLFHPLHQELVTRLKPYFEWAAVDYTE